MNMEPKSITSTTLREKMYGIFFSLLIISSAFFGAIYVLMPLIPLIFFYPKAFRYLVDHLVGFWLIMPSGLLEYMFGITFYISGDEIDCTKPALILMNHRTRLDWLYFWNALYRINPWLLISEKIFLKGILKNVPGAGWAMASNAFIFLDRFFAFDKPRISWLIDYFATTGGNYQLLLFPEGTDKCPIATEKSRKFALKNNLNLYNYVLHPRTTGFAFILQKMREVKYIEYVYDVTCAYSDAIVQSEIDLMGLGATAKEVHFDIRKIPINKLPTDQLELEEWLKNLWAAKEKRLETFYTQLHTNRAHRLDTLPNATKNFNVTPLAKAMQMLITAFWVIVTILWLYFFHKVSYQLFYLLFIIMFFIVVNILYGGIDMLMVKQANRFKSLTKKDKKNFFDATKTKDLVLDKDETK